MNFKRTGEIIKDLDIGIDRTKYAISNAQNAIATLNAILDDAQLEVELKLIEEMFKKE